MARLINMQKSLPSVMHMERASDSSGEEGETKLLTLALTYHGNGLFFTKNTSQGLRPTFLSA